jgi:thioredoxin reductase
MARTDTLGETLADAGELDCDVLVVGGAAGLSAATFLARYGLDTLVLSRGKSAIMQCAHLENYLGCPGGIPPGRFVELGRTQAEHEGATVREELVETVTPTDLSSRGTPAVDAQGDAPGTGGFTVETDDASYETRYVLLGTAYDGDMLGVFGDEIETDDEYGFVATDDGRTASTGSTPRAG